mmetsp:Transcript_25010/g.37032  ORF Transcript_25010/g.37032 Transcript_25010/m.37032 type:complete len:511 (-) Transcript_25010:351-1883(-)
MTSNARVLVKFLPFEVKLQIDTSKNRRLRHAYSPINWFSSSDSANPASQHRQAFELNVSELTSVLKDYFDEYLQTEFDNANGKTIYAPFSSVSLSSLSGRRLSDQSDRVQMDGIINSKSAIDSLLDEDQSFDMDLQTEMDVDLIPIRSGNLRRRKLDIVYISRRYDGVAVFTRDGELPVPSPNFLQAKQLQAQSDENGELLDKLQSSDKATGLHAVTGVELSASTSEPETPTGNGNAQTSPATDSFDAVIIIAVVVAACSMLLLGFAIYLAFRRRQDSGTRMQKTNEISPTTRGTENEPSPQGQNTKRGHSPPVLEINEGGLQHDDAISEYTESVYSLPSAVKSAKKAWLQHSSADPSDVKSAKASARFNPKYILSSRSNASSSADEGELLFENRGATEEMEGVPQMTSPMKKALRESEGNFFSAPASGDRPQVADVKHATEEDKKYADIIDDDIHSSLSAYGNGGISNHFKSMVDKTDDGESVVSLESYGFSLDGADYSTVANSTKYGY